MYEFPNLSGHRTQEEALEYVRERKLLPVKIEPLEEAKHIFSHIEWHMRGYMIRIAQLDDGVEQPSGFVFAQAEVSEEKYAILRRNPAVLKSSYFIYNILISFTHGFHKLPV